MLNRRIFFKNIGAAILGTAIALELPDSIVPKAPAFLVSNNTEYAFGWTGFDNKVQGRILAMINLEILNPRISRTIYMEDC